MIVVCINRSTVIEKYKTIKSMKYLIILISLTSCIRDIQNDYNAYGVIKSKKVKSGLNRYKIEINPDLLIKYKSLDDFKIGDTILIQSKIVR